MAYSGYRIDTYIDVNPNSASYQQQRTERVQDTDTCPTETAEWSLVARYCEVNSASTNTGYMVLVEEDVNPNSPTYQQQRSTRIQDLEACPEQSTEPQWNEIYSYCETTIYQPSGIEGNTGYLVHHQIDENRYSPTWKEERDVKELSSACPKFVDCSLFNFVDLAPSAPPIYNTQYLATYTLNDGLGLVVVSKPDWVYKITEWDITDGKRFTAHMSSNPMLEERVGEVAFMSESGGACTFVATVTQSGATPCSAYNFVSIDSTYLASGETKVIATYADSAHTATSGLYVESGPSWIDNISESTSGDLRVMTCTVHRNYSDARQGSIVFLSEDQHCTFSVNITQEVGQGSVCDEYNFVNDGITIPASGGTFRAGVCAAQHENFILLEKPDWVTDIQYHLLAGRRSKSIDITAEENTATYPREGVITLKGQEETSCIFTLNFTQLSL